MQRRKLKASELRGRNIYQVKNQTFYSEFYMKDYGYYITNYDSKDYYSYSLRGIESVIGFILLLLVSKNALFSLVAALLAYIVLTALFYFRFLRKLEKVKFKKEKKDNFIIQTAKEMSKARILAIAIICLLFTFSIIYYGYSNFDNGYIVLFVLFGCASGLFSLLHFISLIYKIIKKL